jgi:16S rRNA (uracil1498-N3)-methyltransferase
MTDPLFVLDTVHDDTPLTSDALHAGWNLALPDTVKHHAIQVMRLRTGDSLQLSDGNGLRVRATLVDAAQGIAQISEVGREPRARTRLALIQALAKTGHDEQAIDMATQIGVDEVIPWQAERSIAKWREGRSDRKWRQTLLAATEQSRRAWMPELGVCATSKQVLAICRRASVHNDLVVVLHQDATTTWGGIEDLVSQLAQRCLDDGRDRTIFVVVGPEGGISDHEIGQFAGAGAQVCVLGPTIMRASSAGPVALALLSRALGRFV